MRLRELIKEEGYDTQRDKDAVSGKPRKTSIGGGKKPKGYSKDKAEKAAVDNIKKALAKKNVEETTASAVSVSMGGGNGFVNGGPGTISRAGTTKKRKKKRSQ